MGKGERVVKYFPKTQKEQKICNSLAESFNPFTPNPLVIGAERNPTNPALVVVYGQQGEIKRWCTANQGLAEMRTALQLALSYNPILISISLT